MIEIHSQQNLVQEYGSLLEKINDNIANLAQYKQVEMGQPSVSFIEKLNRLKYHRKHLQDTLELLGNASEESWQLGKDRAQEIFDDAHTEWQKISETLHQNG